VLLPSWRMARERPEGVSTKRCFQHMGASSEADTDGFHPPRRLFFRAEPPRSGSSPLALDRTLGRAVKASDDPSQLSCPAGHHQFNAAVGVLRLFTHLKNLS